MSACSASLFASIRCVCMRFRREAAGMARSHMHVHRTGSSFHLPCRRPGPITASSCRLLAWHTCCSSMHSDRSVWCACRSVGTHQEMFESNRACDSRRSSTPAAGLSTCGSRLTLRCVCAHRKHGNTSDEQGSCVQAFTVCACSFSPARVPACHIPSSARACTKVLSFAHTNVMHLVLSVCGLLARRLLSIECERCALGQ